MARPSYRPASFMASRYPSRMFRRHWSFSKMGPRGGPPPPRRYTLEEFRDALGQRVQVERGRGGERDITPDTLPDQDLHVHRIGGDFFVL